MKKNEINGYWFEDCNNFTPSVKQVLNGYYIEVYSLIDENGAKDDDDNIKCCELPVANIMDLFEYDILSECLEDGRDYSDVYNPHCIEIFFRGVNGYLEYAIKHKLIENYLIENSKPI